MSNVGSVALVLGLCYDAVCRISFPPNKTSAPYSELQNLENMSVN